MQAIRTHYEPHLGRWLVDSWVVLLPAQMEAIRHHTLKLQRERHANMPPGEVIDWQALEKDAQRVSALLELWQAEMQELEDEEILLLLMAA